LIKKADLPESAISAEEIPAPTTLRRVVIAIMAIGVIAIPLFAGWRYVRKSTLMISRLSSEIDDPETGLKAIARDSARSEARLSAIDAFLGAKFPEFGALFKIQEAQKAADDGDFSKAIDLLKKARALFSDAEDRKIDAPPDIFASAIEGLSAMETTTPQAASAVGPVLNDLRVLLANYRSSLQQAPNLNAPFHGAPVRSASEISHLSITGGNPAVVNPHPAGQLALFVSDVRIIKPAFQALDGIRWKDVTFVDTSIEYSGGPVDLINVRFINCDFIVHPSANAKKFLEYAALDRHEEFSISGTALSKSAS
jgi:hypothetical protein